MNLMEDSTQIDCRRKHMISTRILSLSHLFPSNIQPCLLLKSNQFHMTDNVNNTSHQPPPPPQDNKGRNTTKQSKMKPLSAPDSNYRVHIPYHPHTVQYSIVRVHGIHTTIKQRKRHTRAGAQTGGWMDGWMDTGRSTRPVCMCVCTDRRCIHPIPCYRAEL